jgi:hypothetical protein
MTDEALTASIDKFHLGSDFVFCGRDSIIRRTALDGVVGSNDSANDPFPVTTPGVQIPGIRVIVPLLVGA